jgi:predicted Zn-dependent peptidase
MSRIGRAVLFDLPVQSLDQMLDEVDAVSVDDLEELAAELYAPELLSAACIGAREDCFRKALEPVSPALAAA